MFIQDIGMEFWHRKICHADNEKWIKETMERIELQNQESIRTLEGEENSKNLEILEADTI